MAKTKTVDVPAVEPETAPLDAPENVVVDSMDALMAQAAQTAGTSENPEAALAQAIDAALTVSAPEPEPEPAAAEAVPAASFRVVGGFPFVNPLTGQRFEPGQATAADEDSWLLAQVDGRTMERV